LAACKDKQGEYQDKCDSSHIYIIAKSVPGVLLFLVSILNEFVGEKLRLRASAVNFAPNIFWVYCVVV
jgi:hypothetical protein